MGLFGKKKQDEEEIDEEFEQDADIDLQNRKLTRQLRDLKSENKKKRKEPPKPWGKKERLTVLVVMVVTILVSGVLFLMSNNNLQLPIYNLQIMNNFQLSKPDFGSLNIFKEETIEIRKK